LARVSLVSLFVSGVRGATDSVFFGFNNSNNDDDDGDDDNARFNEMFHSRFCLIVMSLGHDEFSSEGSGSPHRHVKCRNEIITAPASTANPLVSRQWIASAHCRRKALQTT
jgi:hypothetical protein